MASFTCTHRRGTATFGIDSEDEDPAQQPTLSSRSSPMSQITHELVQADSLTTEAKFQKFIGQIVAVQCMEHMGWSGSM